MTYYEAFSKITGDAAPQYFTSVEQAAQFVVDNFGEEALSEFDLREANQAKDQEQAIKQAQQQVMQEERADESTPEIIAKNIVRMILPYSAEEAETKGQNTSSGMMRDIANIGMILSNPASIPAKFALGGALTAADISAQKEYQGEIDPTRTATVGALSQAPVIAQGAGKIPGVQSVGDWIKERAKGQAFGSIGSKEKYTLSANPITPEKIEDLFLKENKIPILTSEVNALKAMDEYNEGDIARKAAIRSDLAENIKETVDVLKYDFDNQGGITRGAISDAIQNILSKRDKGIITAERAHSMIRELNRQDKLNAEAYIEGGLKAQKAVNLVSALADEAKTYVTQIGKGTPKSEALREYAMAINNRIERDIPELRASTRAMAPNYAVQAPIEERIKKATVNQPTSGFLAIPGINEVANFWTTFNRRPQGAQFKYNLGQIFTQGSPILREAVKYSQSLSAPIGTMIPFKRE